MAVLFPDISEILSVNKYLKQGEKYILEFLMSVLDDSFEIYFHPFLNGETPDIFILRKESGAVIIEVNDCDLSKYSFDGHDFILKSDGSHIKSPFDKITTYKENLYNYHIESLLKNKLNDIRNYGIIKCMVYFYNGTAMSINNLFKNSSDKSINNIKHIDIFARESLNKENFLMTLSKKYMLMKSKFFTDEIYTEIKQIINMPFHKYEDGKNITYTKKQRELINSRPGSQKVKGVAGSGKTIIMAKRAVNAHKRTMGKVLILTFNITLRNYIKDTINKIRDSFSWENFTILNYHRFILNEINRYNISIKEYEKTEDFQANVFDNIKIFENIEIRDKYDAVFIDEVQDYKKEWLDIIKKFFLKENGEYVVYGDEKQNVYLRETENRRPITNIVGSWNVLNESYRLSSKIFQLALMFQKKYFNKKYDLDNIICINTTMFETENTINYYYMEELNTNKVCDIINEILIKNNIHPNDMCVIGNKIGTLRSIDYKYRTRYNRKTNTVFETEEQYIQLSKIKNKRDIDNIRRSKRYNFCMNSGMLKISTIHSFKGWEIQNAVLLIDKMEKNIDEIVYTGCTRCLSNLTIINIGNVDYESFFKQFIDFIGGSENILRND